MDNTMKREKTDYTRWKRNSLPTKGSTLLLAHVQLFHEAKLISIIFFSLYGTELFKIHDLNVPAL